MAALLLLASPEWHSSPNIPQAPYSVSVQHAHSLGDRISQESLPVVEYMLDKFYCQFEELYRW